MYNELAFKNRNSAIEVAKLLLDEDYIVMLSNEEDLTIINYEWVEYGDRNGIVFMNKEEFEEKFEERTGDAND